MSDTERREARVQLEVPLDVLCRLLRERNLVASEFRGLNDPSRRAGWWAVKSAVRNRPLVN